MKVRVITVDQEKEKLVLSAKEILKEQQKLKTGYRDIGKGRVRNASKAFEEWQRKCETSE